MFSCLLFLLEQSNPHPIFDLTLLLTTGKPSSAFAEFNQSGDLTSGRVRVAFFSDLHFHDAGRGPLLIHPFSDQGLQKWENAVTEALIKIRDDSEKRIAPACQRLHLILEEVRGWSLLCATRSPSTSQVLVA